MKKLDYLYHIDALRAIAVLLVIFFHLDITFFKGGFIGVDVFFVISGFLITRILRHEFLETGKINFKSFYLKRLRRLIPTLYLTIFLTFVLTFLTFSPSDFIKATSSMFKSSIAISNFHFLGESDYFDTASNFKPLLHTWSLGIEEQFYLIFPITLFFLMTFFKKKQHGIVISLIVLFILSLFYTYYTSVNGISKGFHDLFSPKDDTSSSVSSIQFFLLPFRMFEFLTGSIIAIIVTSKIKSEPIKLALNILGLSLIISSAIILDKNTSYLSVLNLIPCIGAAILLYFSPSKHLQFLFNSKPLKYIGKISYTLYLLHWLFIVIYRYIADKEFTTIDQVVLLITMFLFSALVHKYYETPLRYKKAKYSFKTTTSIILFLLVGILSTYAIKLTVNYNEGFLWRLSKEQMGFIKKNGAPKDYNKNNWGAAGYKTGWVGKAPEKEGQADIILIGDSHAAHYLYGLDEIFVKQHNKYIYIPEWTTTLRLPDIIRNDEEVYIKKSKKLFTENIALIAKHPKSVVFLSQSWLSGVGKSVILDDAKGIYHKFPKDSTKFSILTDKIEKLHQIIGKNRKLVIFGSSSPRRGRNKLNFVEKYMRPKYITSILPKTSAIVQTFTINKFEASLNSYFKNHFSKSKNIFFIDPSDIFCNEKVCLEQKGDEIYFSDDSHLSKDGSLKAVKFIEKELIEFINNPIK